uniref:Uncharacterized protein n=1 Tax=Fusarium oxysporum (strain Fo5176) TaxID=660025 RepID=A0A0D2XKF0_FUSOF
MSSETPPPPPKVEYPTSVDKPEYTTGDNHTVGVDYNNGASYVDTTTNQPIHDSDVHTRFSGYGDSDDGDSGGIVEEIVDAVTDSCVPYELNPRSFSRSSSFKPKWADFNCCICRMSPTLEQDCLLVASVGIFMEERYKNASSQMCTLRGIQ